MNTESNMTQHTHASDYINDLIPQFDLLTQRGRFQAVEEGVTGTLLKSAVQILEAQNLFARVLGTDKSNLSKQYKKRLLSKPSSDTVILTLAVLMQAADAFGDKDKAKKWLSIPIPALGGAIPNEIIDTQAGRDMVLSVLKKIQYGDFS